MTTAVDSRILHAIQLSPRISFRRLGEVIGVPEQTVARRYHRMHRDGVVRVVGLVNPEVHGDAEWIARVHARPADLPPIAEALVRRSEVTHANVHSGSTELVCVIRAPLDDGNDGLLQRLPRTTTVLSLDVDLILHRFGDPSTAPWTALGHRLSATEAAEIVRTHEPVTSSVASGASVVPTPDDGDLLAALAEDGRTPSSRLAAITGWPAARVARRVSALHASGALLFDVDLLPEALGFEVNAMLWLTAAPKHLRSVGEQVAAHDEIASCAAVSGRQNLMAIAICRDVAHLYRYLTETLAAVDDIASFEASIRTERKKQTTSLISRGRLVHAGAR